jgi:uncharacterized protein
MSVRLPEFIDPWHFAEIGKELTGQVRLTNLSRLKGILLDQEGEAEILLRFHKGENRQVHIAGYVNADLKLECQRCLEPVTISVTSEVDVVVVEGYEESKLLADELEPLLAGDKRIRLNEVIEEELLLALPQVPMHPEDECKVAYENYEGSQEQADEEKVEKKPNPFAVLKDLKSKPN